MVTINSIFYTTTVCVLLFIPPTIQKNLEQEGLYCSQVGMHKSICKFIKNGCLTRMIMSSIKDDRWSKENFEAQDDETSAYQIDFQSQK